MGATATDWYEESVEAGVRDLVRMLRDNGVNTVSSCHHDMTIQCEYVADGRLQDIHNLLYDYLLSRGEPVSYELAVSHFVERGYVVAASVEIRLVRERVGREAAHGQG